MPRVARLYNVHVDSVLWLRACRMLFPAYSEEDRLMVVCRVQGTLSKHEYGEREVSRCVQITSQIRNASK